MRYALYFLHWYEVYYGVYLALANISCSVARQLFSFWTNAPSVPRGILA